MLRKPKQFTNTKIDHKTRKGMITGLQFRVQKNIPSVKQKLKINRYQHCPIAVSLLQILKKKKKSTIKEEIIRMDSDSALDIYIQINEKVK